MGTVLAEIGPKQGGVEFPKTRRRSPVRPVNFENLLTLGTRPDAKRNDAMRVQRA
jgi:hypothetical protein